jgi:hypothetical protein
VEQLPLEQVRVVTEGPDSPPLLPMLWQLVLMTRSNSSEEQWGHFISRDSSDFMTKNSKHSLHLLQRNS